MLPIKLNTGAKLMKYFSNPTIVHEYDSFGNEGHVLHAFTTATLDCLGGFFDFWERYLLEMEAIWLADQFDSVVIHQI